MATTGPLLAAMAAELRAEQARQKLTGRELAKRTGIAHNTQQRYLSGDSVASPDDLDAIARALGTDLFAVHAIVAAAREAAGAIPAQPRRRATDTPRIASGQSDEYVDVEGLAGAQLAAA